MRSSLRADRPAPRPLPLLSTLVLFAACSGGNGEPDDGQGSPVPVPGTTGDSAAAAQAEHLRGLELADRRDLDGAVEAYRRALELEPDLAAAHHDLGRTLIVLSHVQVGRGGEAPGTDGLAITLGRNDELLDEAIEELGRAMELEPENVEFAYWTGRALHKGGRLDEAAEVLTAVVASHPDHGLAHKRLGLVYLHGGRTDEARASFQRAMELLPDDPGAPFQYGNLLVEDDPEGARAAFERAIEIDPTFPWAYSGLIGVLARLGDAEGAERAGEAFERWRAFDELLQVKSQRAFDAPADGEAQLAAGELYFGARRWAEALPFLRRALALDPSDPLLHLYCGITLRHLGELEVARQHLEEAAFLAPDASQPRLELVRVCAEQGEDERVEEVLTELVSRADELDGFERLELADTLLELGRAEEATTHYRAVLETDPESSRAADGLARAAEEDGR